MKNNDVVYNFLLNKSAIIFLEVDDLWNISKANEYACKLFGKDLTGNNLKDFIVDFSGKFDFDKYLSDPTTKHMLNVNTNFGLPNTYYFTFLKEGTKYFVFGEANSMEIEDFREAFLSLNNELNNLTRKLQKKNSDLNKLNNQKNEFIGMAAHDLRNPISIIMGYSEFILEEAESRLPEQHVRFLKIILHSSVFMLKMLNELLDIAKIESGKLNLEKQKTDVGKLIINNVSLNRIIAEKKNIQISLQIYEALPEIMVDPDKIDQVLNNLISNAIKYSNPKTSITVSAFQSKNEITIAIKDQGQGISEQDKEKLFMPFSKLSTKSTAGEKSTGLGLTITKKIIMGHGGRIWLESEKGKGTTFYLSLPPK